MSSEFGKDHGLIHEAVVTGRKAGADEKFWAAIAHSEDLFSRVVAFVAEALRVFFTLAAKVERDMTGWACVELVQAEEGEFEPFLQEFLRGGETCVGGEEMVKRARQQGTLTGLCHAEAMLRNQERIPMEWRKYYLVFPEVWQSPDGRHSVWCLYWNGRRWSLLYCWLDDHFYSDCRLVASRKYQK